MVYILYRVDSVKVSNVVHARSGHQHHLYFYLGGGRRRGNTKTDGSTGLNRGNTIIAPGYGGMRHYLNQIPYVTPPSQSEYVEWFSR